MILRASVRRHALVGRTVKVLAWDDLRDVLPIDPSGIITHVADIGEADVEVTVRVEGMAKNYIFGLDEVEVLPHRLGNSSATDDG
jgi:hypothetical protein